MKKVPIPYKIILSANASIPIDNYDDMVEVIQKIHKTSKGNFVITKHGVFNPSFCVGIIVDYKLWQDRKEYLQHHEKLEEEQVSEFAKLLAPNMKMLK
jgi:hypothetical protein